MLIRARLSYQKREGLTIGESSERATGKKGSWQATGPFAKAKFESMMTTELEADSQRRDGVGKEINRQASRFKLELTSSKRGIAYVDRYSSHRGSGYHSAYRGCGYHSTYYQKRQSGALG